ARGRGGAGRCGLRGHAGAAAGRRPAGDRGRLRPGAAAGCVFFFKQKTAYEIGLGIPAEPLFRSIRNGRSASLQRTFKKSFTSFSHSTRNKTRDGLIRVRNIRALNGRFNTSITHAYSIVIGSKHITLNATGGGFL